MDNQIKLVALDFDMTLVDHTDLGVQLPNLTQELLISLIGRGIDVGIVTGRYVWEMKDILERLNMKWGDPFPSFYITREAMIFRMVDGEMRPDQGWNDKYTLETADFMKGLSVQANPMINYIETHGLRIFKWILYSDYAFEIHFTLEEDAEMAINLIQPFLEKEHITARVHRNRTVMNVMYSQTGKGNTLLRLAQSKQLHPGQVLAIGDSLNDRDMLDGHLGFRSGAVDNAAPLIKEIVASNHGIIAKTRAGWGVAEIIQEYGKRGCL